MMRAMKAKVWLWLVAVAWLGMAAAAWGTALDVALLEREVREEIAAFRVATGRETLEGARLGEAGVEVLAWLVPYAPRVVGEELRRRELTVAERARFAADFALWAYEEMGEEERRVMLELAEEWGRGVWADWESGALSGEERREAAQGLGKFCFAMVVKSLSDGAKEEGEVWMEREREVEEVCPSIWGSRARIEEDDEEEEGEDEEEGAREERGDGRPTAGHQEGVRGAARRVRRGVELAALGRVRDATAEWGRAAVQAEEEGEAELASEARALLLGEGDWRGRREERRARCEAEIAAGSAWGEYLRERLEDFALEEGDWEGALAEDLQGWLEFGGAEWGSRAGMCVAALGGRGLEDWHAVAGAVLEGIPAVEERREEIKWTVMLRWGMGELFPGRVGEELEGDLEGVAARSAAVKSEKGKVKSEDTGEGGEAADGTGGTRGWRRPGERWRGGEPSWRTDGAFGEMEREFNEILLFEEGWEERVKAWRAKWSLEERRALRVEGAGAEFELLAAMFLRHERQLDWRKVGRAALAEARVQEGYDGGRLLEVLARMIDLSVSKGGAEASELADWVDWARRVAAGDRAEELRAALAEWRWALWAGDEAALRRLEGAWGGMGPVSPEMFWPGKDWQRLARDKDERGAAALATAAVGMSPGVPRVYVPVAALAMMDVMTAEELQGVRDRLCAATLASSPDWKELARQVAWMEGRGWGAVGTQLRLARLQERGAECGEEGRALAERLGEGSARGVAAELKGRLAGGAGEGEAPEEEGGRWAGWCKGVRRVVSYGGYYNRIGAAPWRTVWDEETHCGAGLAPWLDRMVQRPLREALAERGGEMTAGERSAVAGALEALGAGAPEEVLADWREAAGRAGEWAEAALERGREKGEKAREEERRREERFMELKNKPREEMTEEEREEWERLVEEL